MPCPHGIGDCSSICHLRTDSLFRSTERQNLFILGGLDSERPPNNPDRFSLSPQHVFPGVVRTILLGTLYMEAWAAVRRRSAT